MSVDSILKKHRKVIISSIEESSNVYEHLYSYNVLTEIQYQIVQAQKTQIQKATQLFHYIYMNGQNGFFKLCKALKEDYIWIYDDLIKEANLNGIFEDENEQHSIKEKLNLIPQEILNLVPNERQLMQISKELVQIDWKEILYELGLTTSTIEHCKHSDCETSQCRTGLIKWLRQNGDNATFLKLFEATKNAEIPQRTKENLIMILQT